MKLKCIIVVLFMLFTVNVFAADKGLNDDVWVYEAQVVRVIDGDTIEVIIDLGLDISYKDKIRFLDYDAPETYRPKKPGEKELGLKAKAWLKNLIEGKVVVLHIPVKKSRGKYGRVLADVFIGEIDVIETMKYNGFIKKENYENK